MIMMSLAVRYPSLLDGLISGPLFLGPGPDRAVEGGSRVGVMCE